MKARNIIMTFTVFAIMACGQESKDNVLSTEEVAQGWQLLFDGKSMEHWRNFNSDGLTGWAVEDGCLVALGLGGDYAHDIITREQYDNFEFKVEWKLTPEANSGVFYLAQELDGVKAIYEVAPEYQIIDDEGWPGGLEDWQKTAVNYAMHTFDPALKQVNPIGEFNATMVRVNNGQVQHWLNDIMVLEYQLWDAEWDSLRIHGKWQDFPHYGSVRKGHIGLQDHGNKIYFRNIKVRDLNK